MFIGAWICLHFNVHKQLSNTLRHSFPLKYWIPLKRGKNIFLFSIIVLSLVVSNDLLIKILYVTKGTKGPFLTFETLIAKVGVLVTFQLTSLIPEEWKNLNTPAGVQATPQMQKKTLVFCASRGPLAHPLSSITWRKDTLRI